MSPLLKIKIASIATLLIALTNQVGATSLDIAPSNSPDDAKPVRWQSCKAEKFNEWFEQGMDKSRLQCGYVQAPLAYATDNQHALVGNSRTVNLAVTRLPATGKRLGSIVMISGGPGSTGVDMPLLLGDSAATAILRKSYDIIGYDPRGVGSSTPTIDCSLNEDSTSHITHVNDVSGEEKDVRERIDACIENMGVETLRYMGTHEAVNDLDVIRRALGEKQLNAISYSYGTKVAAMYAERFPGYTRALVLDGVVNINEDAFTGYFNQALSYQQVFRLFSEYCIQSEECPLSGNHEQTVRALHLIFQRLDKKPLALPSGREINGSEMMDLLSTWVMKGDYWDNLIILLDKLNRGETDKQLEALISDEEDGSTEDAAANDLDEATPHIVIRCADEALQGGNAQQQRINNQRIVDAASFQNYRGKTSSARNECDLWPFPGKDKAHIPTRAASLPPLLFVSYLHDAATPLQNAQEMARWFNSPLITGEGVGHGLVFVQGNLCVDNAVVDYFLNPQQKRQSQFCRQP